MLLREARVATFLESGQDSTWALEFATIRILQDTPFLLERRNQERMASHAWDVLSAVTSPQSLRCASCC